MDNKKKYESLSRLPVPDETMPSGTMEPTFFPANVERFRDDDRFKRLVERAGRRQKEEV